MCYGAPEVNTTGHEEFLISPGDRNTKPRRRTVGLLGRNEVHSVGKAEGPDMLDGGKMTFGFSLPEISGRPGAQKLTTLPACSSVLRDKRCIDNIWSQLLIVTPGVG